MKRGLPVLLAVVVLSIALPASAEIRLPGIISDGMVLQRDQPVRLWGWAEPHAQIVIRFDDEEAVGVTDQTGRWNVSFDARRAGGPHEIEIRELNGETLHETSRVTVSDVYIGEVWLCSGQSNMEWPVRQSDNPEDEIAAANHPMIRLFHVPRAISGRPQTDANTRWKVCSPANIPRFSAVAYYFGRELQSDLSIPIGLIEAAWGGTRIEPWTPPSGFQSVPPLGSIATALNERAAEDERALADDPSAEPPSVNVQSPAALFNGMIAPVRHYSIRGAIWYQGEANRADGMAYRDKMNALINGWREEFDCGEFPFYFVQLAPFRYGGNPHALPELWEAQTAAINIPNTGMAVITDIGNVSDIHPRNKQDVGRRLALIARKRIYGRDSLIDSGPVFREAKVATGGRVILHFDSIGDGLATRDGEPPDHFEVAGADGEFVAAEASIESDTVVLSAESVPEPAAVRFAWHQEAEPNLVNAEGLPAQPFRAKLDDGS